ncbi:MAG TPA: hypothetical protein VF530_11035 [Planctomycetota bacterium]
MEIALENSLHLSVETVRVPVQGTLGGSAVERRLLLSGGQPGNVGAIVLGGAGQAHTRGAVLPGIFELDGSFLVTLPEAAFQPGITAQGFELHGRVGSPIASLEGSPAVEHGSVLESVQGLAVGERTRLRLVGSARLASLREAFDLSVEVARDEQGFALHLGRDLLRSTGLSEGGEAVLSFARAADVADALESVALLRAFAPIEEALGARRDSGSRAHIERSSPAGGWDNLRIPDGPRRAGDRQPLPTPPTGKSQTKPFEGSLGDAGSVEAPVPPTGPVTTWDVLDPPLDDPRRAGDRQPLPTPPTGKSQTKPFEGPLGDAGSRGAELAFAARTLDLMRAKLSRQVRGATDPR